MTTIQVTDCTTSTPLFPAAVSDSWGNSGYTNSTGYIIEYDDVPGTVLSISAYGYVAITHVLTGPEVANAYVSICLNPVPPSTGGTSNGVY